MKFTSVTTFTPISTNNIDSGGMISEVKVTGKLVRVEKGHWSNRKQDWYARLVFDTGQVVDSDTWYSDY